METPWTSLVDRRCPLPEYPRPQMVRDNWLNLNGIWDFTLSKSEFFPQTFDREILVPYSPETFNSGLGVSPADGDYLWYRKTVYLPESFNGKRTLIHFGAVDCETKVWAGDKQIASNLGGFLPFTAELTDSVINGSVTVTLRVKDESDASAYSRGKQKAKRGGIWYTAQSGIWQTVWIESVPDTYIESLKIRPDFDNKILELSAIINGIGKAEAEFEGEKYVLPARIPAGNCEAWTPENPKLYSFSVTCGEDKVSSYFAMRKFSVGTDGKGIKRLFLNNEPLFNNGLLDQGYWPDGLYTPPTDEAMIFDIQTAKTMGFNVLRKHIKIEPLRWYYHCDRLGMIVWQDMPNGGGKYALSVITLPLFLNFHLKDNAYGLFARSDILGRKEYQETLAAMIDHLYNCPCIAVWVPFNEGWGQFDSYDACKIILEHDNDRIIDHASGWHDQGIGKIRSWHVYFRKYKFSADKKGRAVVLSEFGGYSCRIEGHSFNNRNFGYKRFKTVKKLENALCSLYEKEIAPAREKGLAAAIYTQLTDVEDELNGLITYDRKIIKIDPEAVRKIVSQ